jgi:hypothetical protein
MAHFTWSSELARSDVSPIETGKKLRQKIRASNLKKNTFEKL